MKLIRKSRVCMVGNDGSKDIWISTVLAQRLYREGLLAMIDHEGYPLEDYCPIPGKTPTLVDEGDPVS